MTEKKEDKPDIIPDWNKEILGVHSRIDEIEKWRKWFFIGLFVGAVLSMIGNRSEA